MLTLAMRILTVLGVLMSLGWWGLAPAARASEADSYWMCKTSNPVGWCPTSLTNPLPVSIPSSSSLTANQGTTGTNAQSWWVQIGDTTNGPAAVKAASTAPAATDPALVVALSPNGINTNGQATMANSAPVTLASNQSMADPCTFQAKTNVAISTASGTTALVAGVSAKKIYICSFLVVTPSAISVSLSEGSSSTCGTSNQAAVIGVATSGTAANGVPLAANGGWTLGNGEGTIAATATAADYLCLFQSGTVQLAGNLTYVQQ